MSHSDASQATAAPFQGSPASASSHLLLFEVVAVVLFSFSLYWLRRRRRLLESRMEQRYDRLSRVEMTGQVSESLGLPAGRELNTVDQQQQV